jgi:hypothetical protein
MFTRSLRLRHWLLFLWGSLLILAACGGFPDHEAAESIGVSRAALVLPDRIPCSAWASGLVANTSSMTLHAQSTVDSYNSTLGPYGGSNVGAGVLVQAGTTITNTGATVRGVLRPNTPGGFSVIPVPAGATKLPLGSATPGSLNINTVATSITLAPGDYVAANISVNSPGAIKISPAGQVRIWVTGSLNLGGAENLNGIPRNLAFLVTSSGFVNVNSGGALYGMIYAPTSTINVNSAVFGAVIGNQVTLNSGGAVHFDLGAACPPTIPAAGAPTGLDPLPKPPGQVGCYVGTLNGWLAVECQDPKTILGNNFKSFDVSADSLAVVPPVGSAIPIVYGQVQSTVLAGTESNSSPAGNLWGVQLNTNWFNCPSPYTGTCWDQFAVATDATTGNTAVCIETWRGGTSDWTDQNFCVGVDGIQETIGSGASFEVSTRVGALQAGDFANVAAFAYTSGGSPLVATVAQFSWVSSQDVLPATATAAPNRVPGLYAVVTADQYDLANRWTNVGGGMMGAYNSASANFANAEVLHRFAVSNCQGDVSASGPVCPSGTALTPANVQFQVDATSGEKNNLFRVGTPGVAFPNRNLAVTQVVSSTSNAGGTCLASLSNHLYMKDNEGDNGGTPSNVGGVPFWESPDIFVVPQGAPAPSVTDTPGDVELTSGVPYNVYLRVRNDFGCTSVPGPISVYIDAADPNIGFANWQGVTPGAATGSYDSYGTAGTTIVNAFSSAIIGPFPWTPGAGGHKCLLAAISGPNETPPPVSATAPVIAPAYSSNQIAQRNIQIDSACSYDITNALSTSANLLLGISMSPATPAPGAAGGPSVSFVIGDPGGVWAAIWTGTPGLSSVTNDGTNTTIVLSSSYLALPSVPLAGGQSPSVQIIIAPPASGTLPKVNVSAMLTDPLTGSVLQLNGGSCTATKIVIPG